MSAFNPAEYDAWYQTPRGRWIGQQETALFQHLVNPRPGGSVLDVGAGSGYFSRYFSTLSLKVTALDPAYKMLNYAREKSSAERYIIGRGETLPFADQSFDYCCAVTSLCFSAAPQKALQEMWRVSRKGLFLGLLNRNSLLYRKKAGSSGYMGARWDTLDDVHLWANQLQPHANIRSGSAIFLPGGSGFAQVVETLAPKKIHFGGFLAVYLSTDSLE